MEAPGLLTQYPELVETPSADPAQRTGWNVRDSDVTLVIAPPSTSGVAVSPGTALTLEFADRYGKPSMVTSEGSAEEVTKVMGWLADQGRGLVLNVAGPRESESSGVYRLAFDVVSALLSQVSSRPR